MKRKINVGVVGCGHWSPNLARNLSQTSECEVTMLCDLSEQRLLHMQRLHPQAKLTKRFEDFLENPELHAVVVATPLGFHYSMAKRALEAGKHVFVEKPLATSSAECLELSGIAEAKGLVLMVGHTFHFSPAVNRMKEIIESGDIGAVRYISARRLSLAAG